MPQNTKVTIYTDGACSGNPGPGGWGALLEYNGATKEILGHELETTNNRMELMAAVQALASLTRPCLVDIYTDSKYVQQGITQWIHSWVKKNWRGSNNQLVKNVDLWQSLYNEAQKHKVMWHWVKGHSNNIGNIEADKLAVRAKETAIKMLTCHS